MTPAPPALDARIMAALADAEPALPFAKLRERCRVRAATLSQRLAALAAEGRLIKTNGGYRLAG
jgi:DNA-binding Lrp family transcriptional regulator